MPVGSSGAYSAKTSLQQLLKIMDIQCKCDCLIRFNISDEGTMQAVWRRKLSTPTAHSKAVYKEWIKVRQ